MALTWEKSCGRCFDVKTPSSITDLPDQRPPLPLFDGLKLWDGGTRGLVVKLDRVNRGTLQQQTFITLRLCWSLAASFAQPAFFLPVLHQTPPLHQLPFFPFFQILRRLFPPVVRLSKRAPRKEKRHRFRDTQNGTPGQRQTSPALGVHPAAEGSINGPGATPLLSALGSIGCFQGIVKLPFRVFPVLVHPAISPTEKRLSTLVLWSRSLLLSPLVLVLKMLWPRRTSQSSDNSTKGAQSA
ncbi:hypothetical protein G7046_g3692 [Stylonectria norvegica]|nr:hypothetical protein G7046_g3692 [Stylonectria norvegica]